MESTGKVTTHIPQGQLGDQEHDIIIPLFLGAQDKDKMDVKLTF